MSTTTTTLSTKARAVKRRSRICLWTIMISLQSSNAFITHRHHFQHERRQQPTPLAFVSGTAVSHDNNDGRLLAPDNPKVLIGKKENVITSSKTSAKAHEASSRLDLSLLIIDNYDSYTYNLYSYLATICLHPPIVVTNDSFSSYTSLLRSIERRVDGIVLSPGPGNPSNPSDLGICTHILQTCTHIPILGVCLGHQAIGHVHGASIYPSGPIHGLASSVHFTEDSILFEGLPQNFTAIRYHSLSVRFLPQHSMLDIEPIAWCSNSDKDQVCMALRHKIYPHYGVQFHPESIGTGEHGYRLLLNFCRFVRNYQKHTIVSATADTFVAPVLVDSRATNGHESEYNNDWQLNGLSLNISTSQDYYDDNTNDLTEEKSALSNTSKEKQFDHQPHETTDRQKSRYRVHIYKILSSLPPQQVFDSVVYSANASSFWLDSSTAVKNTTRPIHPRICPTNSRFSIMGNDSGPLSHLIEYYGIDPQYSHDSKDESTNTRLLRISDHTTCRQIWNTDIMSYLREELKEDTDATIIGGFENDAAKITRENESLRNIPFSYRGGFVGYLGYEVRHDTRRSIYHDEICNDRYDDEQIPLGFSGPTVPTAAFLFADRSLVYDHWKEEWYAVGVSLNPNCGVVNGALDEAMTSVEDTILWIRRIGEEIQSLSNCTQQTTDDTMDSDSLRSTKSRTVVNFENVRSNEQYIADIARCHEEIRKGESYELCLTNQMGTNVSFAHVGDTEMQSTTPIALYKILRRRNPAPFAAFLNFNGLLSRNIAAENPRKTFLSLCCSSPERFLSVTTGNQDITDDDAADRGEEFAPPMVISSDDGKRKLFLVESKPIKGTCARSASLLGEKGFSSEEKEAARRWNEKEDERLAKNLACSIKNRAENLMIVDLIRNDLSRVCEAGSVHVSKLMHVESFATVHQLVSTIRGTFDRSKHDAVDVLASCFPGGSMTGAPKLRTMDILNEMERGKSRGPYSGCLGYLSLNGCMDMNIVIRTAVVTPVDVVENNDEGFVSDTELDTTTKNAPHLKWNVRIGAGGAITALSESDAELDEMMLKARAVKEAVQEWSDQSTTQIEEA